MKFSSLFILLGACSPFVQASAPNRLEGPTTTFERKGAMVCAHYELDGTHDLYRDKIFARSDKKSSAISNLPLGKIKLLAGTPESIMPNGNFKPCAKAASETAPLTWIDQSCLSAEGICLPPRAFEIDSKGKALLLGPAQAGPLFAQANRERLGQSSAQGDGWNIKFSPAKP